MSKHKSLKDLVGKLKDHSEKNNDHELKGLCKQFESEVSALDSDPPGPGQNNPNDPPDVPQTT